MANLEKFKQNIGGGIRPNQFRVYMDAINSSVFGENFSFLCHSASLPGSNIGQAPTFHRGRMIPLAGERTFDPWTVVVYADQGMKIRSAFETWSNLINNYMDNTGITSPQEITNNGYKTSALVQLLDRNNNPNNDYEFIKQYKINGMFPIHISEMQLSWQQNDVVGEFSVTFAIENFEPSDVPL